MNPVPLVSYVVSQVGTSLAHNWPFLLFGILSAAALKVYVGTDRLAGFFRRRTGVAVGGAVTVAVATPFCSCGTTAVVLSMLATAVPWAPIVAFMVASPLTSPDELVFSAGFFGWPFALLFFGSSIVLGIAGGVVAYVAERAGLLANQARFVDRAAESSCGQSCDGRPESTLEQPETRAARPVLPVAAAVASAPASGCGCGAPASLPSLGPGAASVAEFTPPWRRYRLPELGRETVAMGRRMIVLFVGFAAIGYTVIGILPTSWLPTLLGGSNPLSVIVAATLGIPFYVSTEANLPLVSSLVHGGMGYGPAMAFLITGAGTSIGAISGGLLIARWRVLAIVVGTLWVGAIVFGLVAGAIL